MPSPPHPLMCTPIRAPSFTETSCVRRKLVCGVSHLNSNTDTIYPSYQKTHIIYLSYQKTRMTTRMIYLSYQKTRMIYLSYQKTCMIELCYQKTYITKLYHVIGNVSLLKNSRDLFKWGLVKILHFKITVWCTIPVLLFVRFNLMLFLTLFNTPLLACLVSYKFLQLLNSFLF